MIDYIGLSAFSVSLSYKLLSMAPSAAARHPGVDPSPYIDASFWSGPPEGPRQ